MDPLKDVEAHGKKTKFSIIEGNFHNISLGQGQEIIAEQAMDLAAKEGHWVILQVCKLLTIVLKKNPNITEFFLLINLYRFPSFIHSLLAMHSYRTMWKLYIHMCIHTVFILYHCLLLLINIVFMIRWNIYPAIINILTF